MNPVFPTPAPRPIASLIPFGIIAMGAGAFSVLTYIAIGASVNAFGARKAKGIKAVLPHFDWWFHTLPSLVVDGAAVTFSGGKWRPKLKTRRDTICERCCCKRTASDAAARTPLDDTKGDNDDDGTATTARRNPVKIVLRALMCKCGASALGGDALEEEDGVVLADAEQGSGAIGSSRMSDVSVKDRGGRGSISMATRAEARFARTAAKLQAMKKNMNMRTKTKEPPRRGSAAARMTVLHSSSSSEEEEVEVAAAGGGRGSQSRGGRQQRARTSVSTRSPRQSQNRRTRYGST